MEVLLSQLDALSFSGRMARMAELGRLSLTDTAVRETLAAWEQGEWYQRFLSLQACYGSRDGAHVLRALADPSRSVRGLAVGLVPTACSDEQVREALRQLPDTWLPGVLRGLCGAKRRNAVDRFLEELAANDDPRLGRYLSYGTAEFARRHLDRVAEGASDTDWRRLARHHPEVAVETLLARSEAATGPDARLRWQANAVLNRLARFRPERALELVRSLLRHSTPRELNLDMVLRYRPQALIDLLLARADAPGIDLSEVAHRLGPQRLRTVLERFPKHITPRDDWFRRLDPEQRREVYRLKEHAWRSNLGLWPQALVALLPREERQREGRRHLRLPHLVTRPTEQIPYARFLPWDEATAWLERFLKNPDPALRAAALSAQVGAARYQREHLGDVLALVRARTFEQDPIRFVMLTALADLPPARWREEHLEPLSTILQAALNAADLSYASAAAAERLVIALLPFHSAWSADWLGKLVKARGQVNFPNLADRLTERQVLQIAPALVPVLRSWQTRERESALAAAAMSLGRRLKVLPEVLELLEEIIRDTRRSGIASQAFYLLSEHAPERMEALVPSLLAEDPSWITQSPVYEYLHYRRQDLLDPYLGRQTYKGRFSTGKTAFLLPVRGGFERWTPRQQATFAGSLDAVIRDKQRDSPMIQVCLDRLAELPAVAPKALLREARVENQKLAIRDAALRALGRLDGGQGVPHLIEALDDDRARVAIYALRGSLKEMPADRALALLRAVPRGKITVAKEVVRLMGEIPGEAAYRDLLAMDVEPLHRDVRVALLRGLWSHLERDETWPVLERAAASPDPALATGLAAIPAERLSPAADRRLCALLARLLEHPDPLVSHAALTRLHQLPLNDSGRVLLAPILRHLASAAPGHRGSAAIALFATYQDADTAAVAEAVRSMLPNRRAVDAIVIALIGQLRWDVTRKLALARAVLAVLATDPLLVNLRVKLAVSALPWTELAELLEQVAARQELHGDAVVAAVEKLQDTWSRPDFGNLFQLEQRLTGSQDERLRRIGLGALVASAEYSGWTEAHRERLEVFGRDASPLVAGAAQFTFPPEEGEEEEDEEVDDFGDGEDDEG